MRLRPFSTGSDHRFIAGLFFELIRRSATSNNGNLVLVPTIRLQSQQFLQLR